LGCNIITFGNLRAQLAICPNSEEPKLFFCRANQRIDKPFTRIDISIKAAVKLCDEVDKLLNEMDTSNAGELFPTLKANIQYARMDPEDLHFWDVAWINDSGEIRYRPVVNDREEIQVVVNAPRETANYKNWRGPILFFSKGVLKRIFTDVRKILDQYFENA